MCWSRNVLSGRLIQVRLGQLGQVGIFSHGVISPGIILSWNFHSLIQLLQPWNFLSWNMFFLQISFSWNQYFHGIFLFLEYFFHEICFHSIFYLKFSFMEKKSWKIPAAELQILEIAIFRKIAKNWKHCNSWNQLVFPYLLL